MIPTQVAYAKGYYAFTEGEAREVPPVWMVGEVKTQWLRGYDNAAADQQAHSEANI